MDVVTWHRWQGVLTWAVFSSSPFWHPIIPAPLVILNIVHSTCDTVNPVVPVFHLFSSGNPDFIIYMDELRVDEFGMTF
jgi:hypothetical protein